MRIPFDIKFRPQIESGEYKVKNRGGKRVRIICWDRIDKYYPIIGLVPNEDGEESIEYTNNGYFFHGGEQTEDDLFIVTPEPTDMSEFGMKVSEFAEAYELAATDCESEEYKTCNGNLQLIIDKYAAELLELAKKELIEDLESRGRNAFYRGLKNGKEQGKAEALRTRATELTENLAKSGLDKDSIPYNLIEFMCDLYTCPNWKEIEETAELYVTRIKAAEMKDLPRWGLSTGCFDEGWLNAGILYYKFHAIPLKTLEELPGFKED